MSTKKTPTPEFHAHQREFCEALTVASRACSSRTSIRALAGVLIEVGKNKVRLTCTDMENVITTSFPAVGKQTGKILAASAHDLLSILKTLEPDSVHVSATEEEVLVLQGTDRICLERMPADDYPQTDFGLDSSAGVKLDSRELERLWRTVGGARSSDETRPVLTGVKLETKGGKLTMVATDSYRLAFDWMPIADSAEFDVIVPGSTVALVIKMIQASDLKSLKFVPAAGTRIGFSFDDTLLAARFIDGTFPNYKKLIPEGMDDWVELGSARTTTAISRIEKVLRRQNSPVRVAVDPDSDEVVVSSWVPEGGVRQIESRIPVAKQNLHKAYVIGFNPKFLREAIEMTSNGETFTLRLIGPTRPGLITNGSNGSEGAHLIMPIKLAS